MSLWWLQPGWTETLCAGCGKKIWPEGDPDWGYCWQCFTEHAEEQQRQQEEYEREMEERYQREMEEMERHFRKHPHG